MAEDTRTGAQFWAEAHSQDVAHFGAVAQNLKRQRDDLLMMLCFAVEASGGDLTIPSSVLVRGPDGLKLVRDDAVDGRHAIRYRTYRSL